MFFVIFLESEKWPRKPVMTTHTLAIIAKCKQSLPHTQGVQHARLVDTSRALHHKFRNHLQEGSKRRVINIDSSELWPLQLGKFFLSQSLGSLRMCRYSVQLFCVKKKCQRQKDRECLGRQKVRLIFRIAASLWLAASLTNLWWLCS